jgi:hypothetical protein
MRTHERMNRGRQTGVEKIISSFFTFFANALERFTLANCAVIYLTAEVTFQTVAGREDCFFFLVHPPLLFSTVICLRSTSWTSSAREGSKLVSKPLACMYLWPQLKVCYGYMFLKVSNVTRPSFERCHLLQEGYQYLNVHCRCQLNMNFQHNP